MTAPGLHRIVENLIESINFTQEVSKPAKQSRLDDKWLNNVVVGYWSVITTPEQKNLALNCFIKIMVEKYSYNLHILFEVMSIFVEEKIYTCKDVAIALVNSDALKLSNKLFFRMCYSYIDTLLVSLDYKANREVFNKSIEKTRSFIDDPSQDDRRCLHFCLKVIRKLLGRQNNLMPAYFAMHELMKCFAPDDLDKQPHKLLQVEITSFMSSFRKPAKLLIPFCRHLFFPIVGVTHPVSSAFHFDASTLIYTSATKGAMLYSESIRHPQISEITKLLMQTRCTDLAQYLLESTKPSILKSSALENAFVEFIYEVMVMIESMEDPIANQQWIIGIIDHLGCCINFFLNGFYIGFNEIFTKLNDKVENKSWIKCRKFIWWFVVNATSAYINKNMLEDFVPCLKFFDILYPSNDRSWSAEIRDALKFFGDAKFKLVSTEQLSEFHSNNILLYFLNTGPLILWMHLLRKSKSMATNLPRNLPPALQPMNELLSLEAKRLLSPDCLNLLNNSSWPQLIMMLNTFSTNNETTEIITNVNFFLWGIKPHQSIVLNSIPDQSVLTDLQSFNLPYFVRAVGRNTFIPNEIIASMSVHVKLLFSQLLMLSIFAEPPGTFHVCPHVIESFCRLILHRETDSHILNKFIENHLITRGQVLLMSSSSANGQSSQNNKAGDKKLLFMMLDVLINRCSFYLTPDSTVSLWSFISNILSIHTDAFPLQIHFLIDFSLIQFARFCAKPDIFLYGLGGYAQSLKSLSSRHQPSQIRLIGDTEEISKSVITTLIQLYKAYEMDEFTSWKTFIVDKIKLLQQKIHNSSNSVMITQPVRLTQLQIREIPESLLSNLNGLITSSAMVSKDIINGTADSESISGITGFGSFQFTTATRRDFDEIIRNVQSTIPPNCTYHNVKVEYWMKLMNTQYYYTVMLRLILECKNIPAQIAGYNEQLSRRASDQCLRYLCDYVVANVSLYIGQCNEATVYSTEKIIEALETFICKLCIVPLDRFFLFLLNRNFLGDTWRVVFLIINDIFTRWNQLVSCINFLSDSFGNVLGNPCHLENWSFVHCKLHEILPEILVNSHPNQVALPIYYNHLVLRLIPTCEIIISSLVHVSQAASIMTKFFSVVSKLFKFHSYPLYFSFVLIRSQPTWGPENRRLMQVLVRYILHEHQPSCRYFTDNGWRLLTNTIEHESEHDRMTNEICKEIVSKIHSIFSTCGLTGVPYKNWRHDQSCSAFSRAIHSAVIELMLCGSSPQIVVDSLISLSKDYRHSLKEYINIFGCIMALFSKEYRQYATHQLSKIITDPIFKSPDMVKIFFSDFLPDDWDNDNLHSDGRISDLQIQLCLWHSMWIHANTTQITSCVSYFREFIKPFVESEGQFLLVCHMCGPLIGPLHSDKTGKLIELVAELYRCLALLPRTPSIVHIDTIADLMYHIKYIYVGHGVLEYVKESMPFYEDDLRSKLKFILPQN